MAHFKILFMCDDVLGAIKYKWKWGLIYIYWIQTFFLFCNLWKSSWLPAFTGTKEIYDLAEHFLYLHEYLHAMSPSIS